MFRLGSNTKAVTGFIAATVVQQHKIEWSTRFFDLFPELKAGSRPDYYDITLKDLLTLRTALSHYTYTDDIPKQNWFTGDEEQQMHEFVAWILKQKPVPYTRLGLSNP